MKKGHHTKFTFLLETFLVFPLVLHMPSPLASAVWPVMCTESHRGAGSASITGLDMGLLHGACTPFQLKRTAVTPILDAR